MHTASVETTTSRLRAPALWIAGSAYVISYVLLDGLGDIHPVLRFGIAPWNPQAGLTLAFLIHFGPGRAWLTAIAVALAAALTSTPALPWPASLLTAAAISGGYAFAAHLLRTRSNLWPDSNDADLPIDSSGYIFRLLTVGAASALLVSAAVMVPVDLISHAPADATLHGFAQHWIGDLNGILTVTPLLLAAPHWRSGLASLVERRWEALTQMLVILGGLTLLIWLREVVELRFLYPMFAPMVWIAFRWGVAATALYTLATEVVLLVALRASASAPPLTFSGSQFLLLTLAATGLLLASVVTERRRSEARLRERETALSRAMRLASLGEFASAITHELNQPITALVSYLRSARILAEPLSDRDPRLVETLEKAVHESIRTSDVLRGLRDFYKGTPQPSLVDLEQLTATVLRSHDARLREHGVRVQSIVSAGLPRLNCDRTQLEMVVHNLLGNAVDAVSAEGHARREIVISATRVDADVLITIEDTGRGVPPDIADQLFNAFVTTKSDGMGLGLAISRSLLRSHGGDLWSESSVLGGARFVARIPIAASAPIAP